MVESSDSPKQTGSDATLRYLSGRNPLSCACIHSDDSSSPHAPVVLQKRKEPAPRRSLTLFSCLGPAFLPTWRIFEQRQSAGNMFAGDRLRFSSACARARAALRSPPRIPPAEHLEAVAAPSSISIFFTNPTVRQTSFQAPDDYQVSHYTPFR